MLIFSAVRAVMMPLAPRAEAACSATSAGPGCGELSLLIVMMMS
jgi:hypothetical protein